MFCIKVRFAEIGLEFHSSNCYITKVQILIEKYSINLKTYYAELKKFELQF
jgi:hypothetical protein